MLTAIVFAILGVVWWGAHLRYQKDSTWKNRRLRSAWAWAMIGALIGSTMGVAAMGTAIAGTIPGALIAYLAVGYIYKVDREDPSRANSATPEVDASPKPTDSNSGKVAPASPPLSRYRPRGGTEESAATRIISCLHCGASLEAPANQRLLIKCGGCKTEFEIST